MTIQVENIVFITDKTEVDENGQSTEIALLHAKMEEDFKDEEKLNHFKNLLVKNHNTAFLIYNNLYNG